MTNQTTLNKEQAAQYVHNVKEMETAVYTLDRAISDCIEKRNLLVNEAQATMVTARTHLEKARNRYNGAQVQKIRLENEQIPPVAYMNGTADGPQLIWSILLLLSLIAGVMVAILGNSFSRWFLLAILPCLGALWICFRQLWKLGVKGSAIAKEIREKRMAEVERIISEGDKEIAEKQAEYEYTLQFQAKMDAAAKVLDAQIALLKQAQKTVRTKLARTYEKGVLKIQYRNIECAIIMDRLFQEGSAPCMESAMEECDERLVQNKTTHQMQNVRTVLGKMTIDLDEINAKREEVSAYLSAVSPEIDDLAWQASEGMVQPAESEAAVAKTQLSKYAREQADAAVQYLELA